MLLFILIVIVVVSTCLGVADGFSYVHGIFIIVGIIGIIFEFGRMSEKRYDEYIETTEESDDTDEQPDKITNEDFADFYPEFNPLETEIPFYTLPYQEENNEIEEQASVNYQSKYETTYERNEEEKNISGLIIFLLVATIGSLLWIYYDSREVNNVDTYTNYLNYQKNSNDYFYTDIDTYNDTDTFISFEEYFQYYMREYLQSRYEGTALLWEVRPIDDSSKVMYLMGSIHNGNKYMYPLKRVIMDAWNNSTALATEIEGSLDLSSFIHKHNLVDYEVPLYDKLPNELYKKVWYCLTKDGSSDNYINRLTPLGALYILEYALESELIYKCFKELNNESSATSTSNIDKETQVNNDDTTFITIDTFNIELPIVNIELPIDDIYPPKPDIDIKDVDDIPGIDDYFRKQAKKERKRIYALETSASRLAALKKLRTEKNMILYMEQMFKDVNFWVGSSMSDFYFYWRTGDSSNAAARVPRQWQDTTSIYGVPFHNRNKQMASQIEKLFNRKQTFFVLAGASHFLNEGNIIDILQATGKYNIKRM
ncbi:MAG: TraB/GumN family protein [Bacteroidetes bacterium]|nr:TraB/GumN family protein [Bacteroidota bacterium]